MLPPHAEASLALWMATIYAVLFVLLMIGMWLFRSGIERRSLLRTAAAILLLAYVAASSLWDELPGLLR
jgi:Na+/H+-dicarboxylate symporter